MFAETINFLNNTGDICETLNNVKEKEMNSSELVEAVVNARNLIRYEKN